MSDFKLFEIIVYPSSEEIYYKKWEPNKEKFIKHQIDTGNVSYNEGLDSFERAFKDVYSWGYNKICGFILIYYNSRDGEIKYEIYKQDNNVYNKKVILRLHQIPGQGLHEYVRNKNNEEIISLIDEKLRDIKKSFFKNNYIDLECYNNLKHNIDFVKIIQGSDKDV